MPKISRNQFLRNCACMLGSVFLPTLLNSKEEKINGSKPVILIHEITDINSSEFDHQAYFESRKRFCSEMKNDSNPYKDLTKEMISCKKIISFQTQSLPESFRIQIKFDSMQSLTAYQDKIRSLTRKDVFETQYKTKYTIHC